MALVDVVKWDEPGDLLVWKFPRTDLSTATQLIVNESQSAVLFKDGRRCDVFAAGRHTLSTNNIPVLGGLINLPFGGETPFAAEVWFVNRAIPLDLKFGTPTPVQVEDPTYQIVIPVRAFGQFGVQIVDAGQFVEKLVGTASGFTKSAVVDGLRGVITSRLKSRIVQAIVREKTNFLEIEAKLDELSRDMEQAYQPDFSEYGLALRTFRIMSISVPEDDPSVVELKKAKAAVARRRIEGTNYVQERTFNVMQAGAENQGGGGLLASAGLGLGVGQAVGQAFQQGVSSGALTPMPPAVGPAPAAPLYFIHVNGQQVGPFGVDVLRQWVSVGAFTPQTPVWRQGMSEWMVAGRVPELASLFVGAAVGTGGGAPPAAGSPPPFPGP